MKKLCLLFTVLFIASHGVALAAQEAPAPHRSPRTPVNRQVLSSPKPSLVPESTVQGQATVIDAEKLRIGDIDIRLFGIVPPQLSASFGPQARAALDKLVTGQPISCIVRDRDQAGRYLATCRTANNTDIAMELLRRGFAVTARGSLASTELMLPYMSAEQSAQSQKQGLWSGVVPPAPVVIPAPVAAAPAQLPVTQTVATQTASVMPPPAPPVAELKKEEIKKEEPAKIAAAENKVAAVAPPLSASSLAPPAEEMAVAETSSQGFFARYQILFTGLIMLATAFGFMGILSSQRRQEKRDEMKAIAAAFRGELTAARGVCQSRLKAITSEAEDKAAQWPRIRTILYQAYVSRLGWLGADLAHQIASIYGQASDYASYYSTDAEQKTDPTPKKQALQNLVNHIEEVLPRLMQIEQTGRKFTASRRVSIGTSEIVDKSITTHAPEKAVAGEIAHPVTSPAHPVWESMRRFARERFADNPHASASDDHDYAVLIEEEMANLTFGEAEEEHQNAVANVTKIRPTGS